MRILSRLAVFLMTSLLTVVAVAAFPYQSISQEASARYGLPVEFITAVMKQESNFNPSAVSPVGAQGLMQLMPGTARELGVTDSFDPRQNIFGGANYLRQQLNRFNGNFALAAAAYNAGPGGLQSAIDRAGSSEISAILPFLPAETRNYIAKVLGYFSDYGGNPGIDLASLPTIPEHNIWTAPVMATLEGISNAFANAIGTTATQSNTTFLAMLTIALLMWIAFQVYTGVGLYVRMNIGVLDLGVITLRSIIVFAVLVIMMSL
jgi:hypothetical protein